MSGIFLAGTIALIIWQSILISNFAGFVSYTGNNTTHTFLNGRDARARYFGYLNLIVFLPLLIFLTFYYTWMRSTLNRCTNVKLEDQKNILTRFFTLLMIAYAFRFIFCLGLGNYDYIVCQDIVR